MISLLIYLSFLKHGAPLFKNNPSVKQRWCRPIAASAAAFANLRNVHVWTKNVFWPFIQTILSNQTLSAFIQIRQLRSSSTGRRSVTLALKVGVPIQKENETSLGPEARGEENGEDVLIWLMSQRERHELSEKGPGRQKMVLL